MRAELRLRARDYSSPCLFSKKIYCRCTGDEITKALTFCSTINNSFVSPVPLALSDFLLRKLHLQLFIFTQMSPNKTTVKSIRLMFIIAENNAFISGYQSKSGCLIMILGGCRPVCISNNLAQLCKKQL